MSVFQHLEPALAMWAIRFNECPGYNFEHLPIPMIYALGASMWLTWLFFHYLIVFVWTYERWNRKKNLTLYSYVMSINSLSPRIVRRIAAYLNCSTINAYCVFIAIYQFGALLVGLLTINIWALTVIVWTCYLVVIWNGAGFYIDYFSVKYEKKMEKIKELQAILKQKG